MKNVQVNWFLHRGDSIGKFAFLEGALSEPEPFLKVLQQEKGPQTKHPHYTSCYALIDFFKNTYVYRSPIDMHITVDANKGWLSTNNFGQPFFDEYVVYRDWDNACGVTVGPRVVFYSEESVVMEYMPIMGVTSKALENLLVTPGKFDIGKLIRPVDLSGEVIDPSKPVVINRGDPLFLLRFITKDDKPVVFNRVFQDERLTTAVMGCVGFKQCKKKTPLVKLYEVLDPMLRALGLKRKI